MAKWCSRKPESANGRRRLSAALALIALVFLAPHLTADEAPTADSPGLSFFNLDLLDSQDGYAIPSDSHYLPAETIYLYFQVKGYEVSDDYAMKIEYRLEAFDPEGNRFYGSEGGKFDTELAPQDDDWLPVVRYSPKIPQHAGGGTYEIKIEVTDLLSDSVIHATLPIIVDASRVETADQLTIRNYGFAKLDGGVKLEEPLYRAGDEIWAAFYITGYKTREDNTFDVESDVQVVNDKGETMFEFDSRGEKGSPFYPRLWLPAKFRLDLEKTIPVGRYTVIINIRDSIGTSSFTERHSFEVR